MNKNNIIRKPKKINTETKIVSFRITPLFSEWLYKNNYSPKGILIEAAKDLGFKNEENKKTK